MENKELIELRRRAQAHIDPIWKSGRMSKKRVYKILAERLGKEIDISEADEDTCKKIIGTNF